jgi:hypothetical protein
MKTRNALRVSLFQLVRFLALLGGSVLLAMSHEWAFAAIGFVALAATLGGRLPGTLGTISGRVFPFAPGLSKGQRIAVGLGLVLVLGIPAVLIQDRRAGTVEISILVVTACIAWLAWTVCTEGWKGNRPPRE